MSNSGRTATQSSTCYNTTATLQDLVSSGDKDAEKKKAAAAAATMEKFKKRRSSSTSSVETARTSAEEDYEEDEDNNETRIVLSKLQQLIEEDCSMKPQPPVSATTNDDSPEQISNNNNNNNNTDYSDKNQTNQQQKTDTVKADDELAASLLQTLTLLETPPPPPIVQEPSSEEDLKDLSTAPLSPSSEAKKAVRFQPQDGGVAVLYPEKLCSQYEEHAAESSADVLTPPATPTDPKEVIKLQRKVSFGHMSVHEFPCALGDHPSVTDGGPPIRLEYGGGDGCTTSTTSFSSGAAEAANGASNNSNSNHSSSSSSTHSAPPANPVYSYTIPVEDYEFSRPTRRTLPQLRVPADTRRQWLRQAECAVTPEEMKRAERAVQRTQRQRHVSTLLQEVEEWQLAHQACQRKVRRWWRNRRHNRRSKHGNDDNGGDDNAVDMERVAEEWYQQYKQQKLAERRERMRLRRSQTA